MYFLGSLSVKLMGVVFLVYPLVALSFVLPPLIDGRRGTDFFFRNLSGIGWSIVFLAMAYVFLRKSVADRVLTIGSSSLLTALLFRIVLFVVSGFAVTITVFGVFGSDLFNIPNGGEFATSILFIYLLFFFMCIVPGPYVGSLRRHLARQHALQNAYTMRVPDHMRAQSG